MNNFPDTKIYMLPAWFLLLQVRTEISCRDDCFLHIEKSIELPHEFHIFTTFVDGD